MRKIKYNSPVILTFALISFLVLLLDYSSNGEMTVKFFSVYRASLLEPLTYFRFFSHVLGHADFNHYINNMLMILLIGPNLEEKYGSFKIILFFIITSFVTGLVQFIFFPTSSLLGASGLVFMMIVLSSFTSKEKNKIPLTFILIFALYLGNEVFSAIYSIDNVSRLTHIIGGLLGAIFGFKNKSRSI